MYKNAFANPYQDTNWNHLRDELGLLNARLLKEVRRRSRDNHQSQFDGFQGLVLTEQEITHILTNGLDEMNTEARDAGGESSHAIKYIDEFISSRHKGRETIASRPLNEITSLFKLDHLEEQCLILCLAPEIDSRYSKVYAFLQDDVTKKYPTVDLALKLFVEDMPNRIAARAVFSPDSRLIKNRILHTGDDRDDFASLLHRPLKIDERIAAFLLDTPQLDRFLHEWVNLSQPVDPPVSIHNPSGIGDRAIRMVESCFSNSDGGSLPVIHLYGRSGSGKRSIAECLGQKLGVPLLLADIRPMSMSTSERAEALWRLGRESHLLSAMVFIDHIDDLFQEGRSGEMITLLKALKEFSPLTILSGEAPWKVEVPIQRFLSIECLAPDISERIRSWDDHLQGIRHRLNKSDLDELAGMFNFTEGQIRQAVKFANDRAFWENQPPLPLNAKILQQACRHIATPNLGGLARKIESQYEWGDIVLPEPQLDQLRELTTHVKRSQVVLEKWGFAKKFPYGRGVTALFNGLSGTGKTMAASIIGAELGLDLYKIDLSCVVSKYIGETEKNLNRIFDEAQDSSAILFFDEADALFGKRSEVKDAHDRYANIETAYLLQKIEDYSGVVILATNMKQNMDEAFVRRMRFIIHFPFPSDIERQLIWEKSFPREAPLGKDVDFRWLARKLKITGGHIKNISLRAAFLAVERNGVIDMDCLKEAATRETGKMGKIISLGNSEMRPDPGELSGSGEVA